MAKLRLQGTCTLQTSTQSHPHTRVCYPAQLIRYRVEATQSLRQNRVLMHGDASIQRESYM